MKKKMRLPPYLTILLIPCFFQCQSSDQPNMSAGAETKTVAAFDFDSLREVYRTRLAAYSNRLPQQQIMEKNKVYPIDEGPLDTLFFLFREDLLDAIENHDVLRLLEACDEHIKSSFGGEDTVPEFIEMWKLDKDAEQSELWPLLRNVLLQGGTFSQNRTQFFAPYTFSSFPNDRDGFTYGLITGEGVRLRENPTINAKIITSLTYDVVELLSTEQTITETIDGEEHPWLKIKTIDGKEGWVYGKFFSSPIDFRAGFEKQSNGRWQMIFLVSGD